MQLHSFTLDVQLLWCSFFANSFQLLRGLFLFVLASYVLTANDEIQRHCCLTFINYDVGTAPATHFQSISLSFTVGLCHDEGSVTLSLLPEERSVRVHPYITPTLTAALLSAKREKGSNVWREGTRGGKKSFLFCIHRRCLSPTARRCYCELKESVRQLSLVCVCLPFSELWRSKKEPEEYNAYHRRELRSECFYVQKKTQPKHSKK